MEERDLMATKTLAERKFIEKLDHTLGPARCRPAPHGTHFSSDEDAKTWEDRNKRALPLDVEAVAKVFDQYGTYLELVGHDQPSGETRVFEWPSPEEAGGEVA